jgi:predicted TIM-barrel fold metal-dependent hydrolase
MAYVEGRKIHDADSHIVEAPDFLEGYVEAAYVEKVRAARFFDSYGMLSRKEIDELCRRHDDPEWRARSADKILTRKNYNALGAFRREDRREALDYLGFASQLVFPTQSLKVGELEHANDPGLTHAAARAVNRAMVDFCSVDRRLLATCYVPLQDFAGAEAIAREAISIGAKALVIPSRCPQGHSPSHVAFDPMWSQAQEAGLPILFHVGGGGPLLTPDFFVNGLPPVPDFHGGDGDFRSVSFMAVPNPPMQALATLIFDRVFDRFPKLKFGVIEQGASWLPGWMRMLDSAHTAFYKNEERLQKMSLRPSEFVLRQVRVTPYPSEDAGWIIANSSEETCMFSTDYPHVEGGRNPLKRFDAAVANNPESARRRFYCDNFVDLMGEGLAADLR